MKNPGITDKKFQKLLQQMAEAGVNESDIEEKFTLASGPGGQNVNKNATCVHLKHKPSGISIKMQKQRSQGLNRYYARKQLCEILEERSQGKNIKDEKIRKQKQRRKRRAKNRINTGPKEN